MVWLARYHLQDAREYTYLFGGGVQEAKLVTDDEILYSARTLLTQRTLDINKIQLYVSPLLGKLDLEYSVSESPFQFFNTSLGILV